jgi:hypothetical protein
MTISFFINSFLKMVLIKKLKMRKDSAASNGGQVKLTHLIYFLSPPLEAEESI